MTYCKPTTFAEAKRTLSRNLTLFRTFYQISYLVGIHQFYAHFEANRLALEARSALSLLFAAAMCLVALRFLWAVGNLRRYVIECSDLPAARQGRMTIDPDSAVSCPRAFLSHGIAAQVMLLHFPALMAHSFVFFLAAVAWSDAFGAGAAGGEVLALGGWLIALLVLNGGWIWTLGAAGHPTAVERVWMRNNLACAASMAGTLAIAASAGRPEAALVPLLAILVLNTWIDFSRTGFVYLFGNPD